MASPEANADNASPARERLEELLAEINALAALLKWRAGPIQSGDVPPATRAVLQILQRRGQMAVPALARARGTSRQNIQTIINRLEQEGWVGLAGNPAHKRSDLVFITESGAAMLESGAAREAEIVDAVLATTSPAELAAACQLIRRLRDVLGGAPVTDDGSRREAEARQPKPPKHEAEPADQELPVSLL